MTQSIRTPWGVSVFGAASVDAVPDLALLRLACSRNHATPAGVFAAARTSTGAIRDALRACGVADKHVSASRLSLTSAWRTENNVRIPNGYDCSVSFVVEVHDLDTLEQVIIDAVTAGVNSVGSVEFDVLAKKELRAKARRKAVAAAHEKAALYAEAAGVALGSVVHIEDVDSENLNAHRSRSSYAGGRDTDGDLTPGLITVQAGVRLGFSLAGPVG